MRHLVRNICIALALVVLASAAAFPPQKKISLGKDLRGGSSLIYTVQMERTESAGEVIPKVIEVLKRRIDPNGLFEISIVRQGEDRIEITMPLPGDHVKVLRENLDNELSQLAVASVDANEFERLMRMDSAARAGAVESASGGSELLLTELRTAAEAYDMSQRLRVQIDLAVQSGAPDDVIEGMVIEAANAEIEYEVARDRVLAAAIGLDEVRRALELSTDRRKLVDNRTGDTLEIESPRERALDRIKSEHPELAAQLDRAVEAYDTFSKQRGALDDTSDLKRLVQASGELSFRITVDAANGPNPVVTHPDEPRLREELREKGPRQATAPDARWYKINKLDGWYQEVEEYERLSADPSLYFLGRGFIVEEFAGELYMLCFDSRGFRMTNDDGRWKIARSFQTADQIGRPAIGFQMDAVGARLLGDLTNDNRGNSMAVLLDDEVYTAPNLRARITTNGIIEGQFTPAEIDYVVRVMTAGSLQAKLSPEPIAESTIAPELGQDNLQAGLQAGIIALIVVGVFMIFYYFTYGWVAVICLTANAILIVGALALSRAALTLPGIAGIILTFGMAVDANVLIFERIREEQRAGMDLRQAMRLGYQKALSSIVDGNVTNLIVCFVLANVGTQEIKGFAITLGIGVACTMISALFFSRILLVLLIDRMKFRKLRMLPTVVPFIERTLEPKIDWMGLRWLFVVVSVCFVGLGVGMVIYQGERMLDTEFRGGTQVTMTFRPENPDDPGSARMTMERPEVEAVVHAIGEGVDEADPVRELRGAEVIAVNPQDGGLVSDTFVIKTIATDRDAVGREIIAAFESRLDTPPALTFISSDLIDAQAAPVYPVLFGRLGQDTNRPELRNDISEFVGGIAILIEDLEPTQSIQQLEDRLTLMRGKSDFVDILGRQVEVVLLEGSEEAATSVALLVLDPGLSYFDNQQAWQSEVAQREWDLVVAALTTTTDAISVQNFSAAIAENFRQKAVVAVLLSLLLILIYIWVRFGSVRYSLAAIATLTHDVFVALGLIALAEILFDANIAEDAARFLLIEPFKIDLNLVAALLTIIGYSLNDTIIIMDRIRENKGKLSYVTRDVVNLSINQTISRTVITSGTTFLAVAILYVYGGSGVRAFSYTLMVGVLFGTYSSIAVASPLVWSRKADRGVTEAEETGIEVVSNPA